MSTVQGRKHVATVVNILKKKARKFVDMFLFDRIIANIRQTIARKLVTFQTEKEQELTVIQWCSFCETHYLNII